MSNRRKRKKQAEMKLKNKKRRTIGFVVALIMIASISGVLLISQDNPTEVYAQGIEINKEEVMENSIKYYDYEVNGKDLQILAVKASDGTIRTAFNTCQICYSSGRGYYEQKGKTLVCNNCGNVFSFDQVELVKGGCNPVPIGINDKIEDDSKITITDDYIKENVALFETWK